MFWTAGAAPELRLASPPLAMTRASPLGVTWQFRVAVAGFQRAQCAVQRCRVEAQEHMAEYLFAVCRVDDRRRDVNVRGRRAGQVQLGIRDGLALAALEQVETHVAQLRHAAASTSRVPAGSRRSFSTCGRTSANCPAKAARSTALLSFSSPILQRVREPAARCPYSRRRGPQPALSNRCAPLCAAAACPIRGCSVTPWQAPAAHSTASSTRVADVLAMR